MASLLTKAFQYLDGLVTKASRGTISDYVLNAPHQYGQPKPEVAAVDAQGLVTPQRMREIVQKVGTPAACMNATLDYCTGVEIAVRNVDHAQPAPKRRVKQLMDLLKKPNRFDNWLEFRQKIFRDLFTMGMAAIEIERGPNGGLANLNVLDMARLYIDFDEHGNPLGYNMLDIRGVPISRAPGESPYAWLPDEVIFIRRDAISESLYGHSRVAQLFVYAVIEDLMHHFISQRFTDSNIPRGVFDLGEITEEELKKAISMWNQQVDSPHKILITGSKGMSHWYPFAYNLKELSAPELLNEIKEKIMAIVGVTKNELGDSEDINKSNGYNLSFTFKKRAIEPLLNAFATKLTERLLCDVLGWHDLELYYSEIDSRDELLQAQIDDLYLKMGVETVDHIRNRKGDPNTPGGDMPSVFTGSAWIPVHLMERFATAQLMAMEAEVALLQAQIATVGQGEGGQAPKAGVNPPLIRAPAPPEKFTTPGGSGSSSFKINYPKATTHSDIGQKPRGPVQAGRNAGMRPPRER